MCLFHIIIYFKILNNIMSKHQNSNKNLNNIKEKHLKICKFVEKI